MISQEVPASRLILCAGVHNVFCRIASNSSAGDITRTIFSRSFPADTVGTASAISSAELLLMQIFMQRFILGKKLKGLPLFSIIFNIKTSIVSGARLADGRKAGWTG